MNFRRRQQFIMRNQKPRLEDLSRADLEAAGRAAGLSHLLTGWYDETIIRKIREAENGSS